MDAIPLRGLYIHIPFCKTRCHYCAFYLEIARPLAMEGFVRALLQEITWYGSRDLFADRPIESVYVGGGTPTTLSVRHLSLILAAVRERFVVGPDAEVSIEAHPDAMTGPYLDGLVEAGFNRISFGAESMDQDELVRIGRPGSPQATARAVELARHAGFANINLDLMHGLPGQTLDGWRGTLHEAVALQPTHLSCYALTVEPETRLQSDIDRDVTEEPDPEVQNELEVFAEAELASAGFHRYEISNYHRPGYACRHNLLYWTGGHYLGLGPSAQSYFGHLRCGNIPNLEAYMQLLDQGCLPVTEIDFLSPDQQSRELFVFGLRRTEGVSLGPGLHEHRPEWLAAIHTLIRDHLLERKDDRIHLTALGRQYADSVAVRLI